MAIARLLTELISAAVYVMVTGVPIIAVEGVEVNARLAVCARTIVAMVDPQSAIDWKNFIVSR